MKVSDEELERLSINELIRMIRRLEARTSSPPTTVPSGACAQPALQMKKVERGLKEVALARADTLRQKLLDLGVDLEVL